MADPCRFTDKESLTANWSAFVNRIDIRDGRQVRNLDSIAVVVPTFHGDGLYPVRVRRNADGNVVGIRIDFD